jgi:hypothetical protein
VTNDGSVYLAGLSPGCSFFYNPCEGVTSGVTDKLMSGVSDKTLHIYECNYVLAQKYYLSLCASWHTGRWWLFTCINKMWSHSVLVLILKMK